MKHNIFVKDKQKSRDCCSEKNLMDSLSIEENLVPKGCHNGACGVCKIVVHSGTYDKEMMNRKHISQEEENENIVLACKVFPKSDMDIEFIKKSKKKCYTFGD